MLNKEGGGYTVTKTISNTNLCSGHSASPALLLQLVDPNPIGQTTHTSITNMALQGRLGRFEVQCKLQKYKIEKDMYALSGHSMLMANPYHITAHAA